MLFADDIVLVDKSRISLNTKLERWRKSLESKGLRVSRSKTKYMYCNFSNARGDSSVIKIGNEEVPNVNQFRYLGSLI